MSSVRARVGDPPGVVVSCASDPRAEGVYLIDASTSSPRRVFDRSCMGVTTFAGTYVLAAQAEAGADDAGSRATVERDGGRPHSIVCTDDRFRVISEAPVDALGLGDLHDAKVRDRELLLVDTLGNRVVVFDIVSSASTDSLVFGRHHLVPRSEFCYTDPTERDACHLNSVCVVGGRVHASIFGPFVAAHGYEGRSDDGQVLDITDSFRPFGSSQRVAPPRIVASGLADPHSLTAHHGKLLLAESRRGRLLQDGSCVATFGQRYVRGLLPSGAHDLWVGLSTSRHGPSGTDRSELLLYDLVEHVVRVRLTLPAKEIYDIAACH